MKFKRFATSVAVAGVLAAGHVGIASSAQAAYTDCPRGSACMWNDADYRPYGPDASFEYTFDLGTSWLNDDVSSIVNNGYTGYASIAYFYEHSGYKGEWVRLYAPGQGLQSRDPHLYNGVDEKQIAFNDKISSATFRNS